MGATPPAPRADRRVTASRFAAMGCDVEILAVDADDHAVTRARRAIDDLERRWSRFRSDSEIAQINAHAGRPVTVSPATETLVAKAVAAWRRSGGRFDPTVLPALEAAGYDRSFEALDGAIQRSRPSPGCARVKGDIARSVVALPADVRIDAGSIASGWPPTSSRRCSCRSTPQARSSASAATCACSAPHPTVRPGGSASSTLTNTTSAPSRCGLVAWRRPADCGAAGTPKGLARHHIIDPRTGRPATAPFVAATAVAGSACDAEVLATTVMLSDTVGQADAAVTAAGAAALVFYDHHWRIELGAIAELLS